VRIGVIGAGMIGREHLAAYERARRAGWPCRVVAVCDQKAAAMSGLEADCHGEAAELLRRDDVDLVSICTRTDSHVPLAVAALEAGKHVLVEKPVALTADGVAPLAAAAAASQHVCVPAHCMRFWPGWNTLRDAVRSGRFGRVVSATFQRLSSLPLWAPEFYGDHARSGGALVDLHVHDVDFIRWCFGDPSEVVSTGSLDHVTTLYRFASGPEHVFAEGGWDHAPGFPFRMRYVVAFEHATADFDLDRAPALVVSRGGAAEPVPDSRETGYDGEVRHVLDLVLGRAGEPVVTLDDALGAARILDAERQSLASRRARKPSG
jgi:predicted dehydrogenase